MLFPLGMGTALSLMGDATLYTVLPTHTADAGIALGSVGIILSANRIIRLFLNGPAGFAYDRLPRRWLFIPALFIGALSTAMYAAWEGFLPLLMGRLLWGLAWSGIWVGGATIILDASRDHNRGHWTGMYQTWFFLGGGLGASIGGFLTDWLGYVSTMWIGAALTALGALIALFLLPETRPNSGEIPVTLGKTSLTLRDNPDLWATVVLQAINRFVIAGVLMATMALLVERYLTVPQFTLGIGTITGLLMVGRTLFSTLAAPLGGTLSDKLGNRWLVSLVFSLIGAVSMGLISWSTPIALISGILLAAVASGSLQTLVTALTGDLVNFQQRGRAIGLLHTSGDLGSALGPLAAYALLPWINLAGIYWICCGLYLLSALLTLFQMGSFKGKGT